MASQKVIGGNPTRNDGGTVVKAGNNDGSVVTKTLNVNDLAKSHEVYGSQVVENVGVSNGTSDPAGVGKALSGGTFAFTPAHGADFLLHMAGPNAANVNGSASTVLAVGGHKTDRYDGIMELNSTRDRGTMTYNVLAAPSTAVVPGRTITGGGVERAFGDDDAAGPVIPSRSVPGELVYMQGGKTPVQDEYKAKDEAE